MSSYFIKTPAAEEIAAGDVLIVATNGSFARIQTAMPKERPRPGYRYMIAKKNFKKGANIAWNPGNDTDHVKYRPATRLRLSKKSFDV